jgi:hypothetical protein
MTLTEDRGPVDRAVEAVRIASSPLGIACAQPRFVRAGSNISRLTDLVT